MHRVFVVEMLQRAMLQIHDGSSGVFRQAKRKIVQVAMRGCVEDTQRIAVGQEFFGYAFPEPGTESIGVDGIDWVGHSPG